MVADHPCDSTTTSSLRSRWPRRNGRATKKRSRNSNTVRCSFPLFQHILTRPLSARTKFQPLYFIRSYPTDKKKIEMSFDLSHYQPQFLESTDSDSSSSVDKKKKYKHLYQTIFLDRESAEGLWTKGEIKKEEIVREEWWKQQSHRVNHYRGTVPFVSLSPISSGSNIDSLECRCCSSTVEIARSLPERGLYSVRSFRRSVRHQH